MQTSQYRDLSSFSDVSTFVALSMDSHGQITREAAPARISLPREDHPDEPLSLQVALIRDLHRRMPVQPDPEEAQYPQRWDSDLAPDSRTWWREDWQATAAPVKETTEKLIPIVTTEVSPIIDAEFHKQERYCKDPRAVLRALEDLKEQERTMYELDNRKDQVMTVCKVSVTNLAMWVRDQYFPPSYA